MNKIEHSSTEPVHQRHSKIPAITVEHKMALDCIDISLKTTRPAGYGRIALKGKKLPCFSQRMWDFNACNHLFSDPRSERLLDLNQPFLEVYGHSFRGNLHRCADRGASLNCGQ